MSGQLKDLVAPMQFGGEKERIREYQRRAEELREIAEDIRDDESRLVLLRIAASYDRMVSAREQTQAANGVDHGHGIDIARRPESLHS